MNVLGARPIGGVEKNVLEIAVPEFAMISGNEEIRGIVVDELEKPVEGAFVQLNFRPANNEIVISPPGSFNATTTSNGQFRFTNVPSGSCKIVASHRDGPRVPGTQINRPRQTSIAADAGQIDLEIVLR